jgi:guanylate kinase
MSAEYSRRPARLILLSAPSGAGKTTLVKALLEREPDLRFSISYTTRSPRAGERDGRDYFFVSKDTFRQMVADGEFLEHASVFDNWYGTGRRHVEALLAAGHTVVLEIDWQGARQVRAAFAGACSVFVLPPSVAELRRRLQGRASDSPQVIERRFRDAVDDISHWSEFDYAIVNDDLTHAADELQHIVRGESEACSTARPAVAERVAAIIAN